jgi:hypothetical protein
VRYYRFLGELIPALLPAVADWPRSKAQALANRATYYIADAGKKG